MAFIYANSKELAESLIQEAECYETECIGIQADISNVNEINEAVTQIFKRWNRIDILVNNAGMTCDKPIIMMTDEEWDSVIKVNLYGVFNITRRCSYYMMRQKYGRIINISSVSGLTGMKGQVNYSSSKAAIIGFTKALAKEVAKYGISVNCVAPGGVDTDMINELKKSKKDDLIGDVPMGRFCRAEEVAMLVGYLSDKEACPEYLTGVVINLDGGLGI